jgi:hypothetical protein
MDCPSGSVGLIGWKVIQRVNTTIDFEELQIRFSDQNSSELHGKRFTDEEKTECVTFLYLTSMYIVARFGADPQRAFVLDTGAPGTEFLDFSAIHKAGRYYFPGIIGIDILRHSVLHILPRESVLCIEKVDS